MKYFLVFVCFFCIGVILGNSMITILLDADAPKAQPKVEIKSKKLGAIVRLVRNNRTFCSGTVVGPHTIITAAHCVVRETPSGIFIDNEPIEIRTNDNVDRHIAGAPYYAQTQLDQALIAGDFSAFDVLPCMYAPAALEAVRKSLGLSFVSCGYPMGGQLYCTTSRVVRTEGFYWALNSQLIPGMSGGPTMVDGSVVAVNCAASKELSFVSPLFNLNLNFMSPETK